jgi:hypothetical protein
MSEFQFIVNGELVTYDKYEDIPETFEHVIKFLPDIPAEPHTEEEHEEIQEWNNKFQKLMEKERASSN